MARFDLEYEFSATLVGQQRSFGFGNGTQRITVRLTSNANNTGGRATDFVVQLQRKNYHGREFTWVTEGTGAYPRKGSRELSWTVPVGIYRLRFAKSTDGVKVSGTGYIHNE